MRRWFDRFADKSSDAVGSPWAFALAVALTVAWVASGPWFHWSDTWQLMINTATTISTGLIVFLIQNTQNRDAKAANKKLDALIAAHDRISNHLIGIERPGHEGGVTDANTREHEG